MQKPSIFYDIFKTPIGNIFLLFSGRSLIEISFNKPLKVAYKKGAAPKSFLKELGSYFSGVETEFRQEIQFLKGTEFEQSVWLSLKDIPYGETRPYKWVAEKIGSPSAVRAVGQALSKNPIPIVLPCHRVVESSGSIGGYSAGVEKKVRLLEMEYYSKMNKNKI
ncbi:MAG: methylated-DNA--[protein]-cysteine S-methyltransferase [Thermodesulfovibrionia bacterium]|nr:methylated-DNA--[protein]-cysteine S-methyltransferase [Thermodesulfovibrionia bacterium]